MWMCNWECGYFEFGFGAGWFGWSVSIDFVELFKLLKSYDFDGAVIMEVYTNNYKDDQELKESFEYLKSCLQKAEK